jgi:GT2 family glycosyltransferase
LTVGKQPQRWDNSKSLLNKHFEPRPILDDISIVIPTLGRDILQQCLSCIMQGSTWPACLIVVNQGPYDKVNGWLGQLQSFGVAVKHFQSNQRGRSIGLNRGLERVETSFVAITDDDCFVDVNWLKNIALKLRTNPAAIVTGRIEAAGEDMSIVVTSGIPAVYRKPRLKFDSMSGGNMGTSIGVLNKVGLFDEDPCLQTAEDAEWSYRALRNKVTIIYDPDVCVWHFGWRDPAKRAVQYHQYALSHGGFYGKYLRKRDLFILFRAGVHLLRSFRRWIKGWLSGNYDLTMIGRTYFRYLLPGIVAGIRSQYHVAKIK